jgi:hypothetical protein
VKVSVPVTDPAAVGENVTPIVQLVPAATLAPHVLLATANPALAAMPAKFNATVCLFVKVTVLAVLVPPTATVPKLKLLVESVTGALPVPVRLTVCGLVIALSANVRTPEAGPRAAGMNVTPTWQLAPAATLAPHVLLATANGPLTVILVTLRATFRRFVTVTVLAGLVLPTANVPKLKLVDDRLTGGLPVPASATFCVPALSVIVTVPETEPTTVGANVTWIVHVAAGAMLPLQLFV